MVLFQEWGWDHNQVGKLDVDWFVFYCTQVEAIIETRNDAIREANKANGG